MCPSSTEPADWAAASAGFRDSVERYFADRGQDPAAAHVQSTVRTNTELVPRRGEILVELLEALGGPALAGARVVEAGSGFGALAGYIAWRYSPREVVAFDIREDHVQSARRSAEGLGVGSRLHFETGDMRDFAAVEDGWADVVLLNNAFIYLPTRAEMEQSLSALARVVRPGGVALLYHANRWSLREPFSKDPLVHLLSPALADRVANVTGWKHNHGRVRLLSPPEMRRRLGRAGFRDVRVGAYSKGRVVTGRDAYLARYYGTVGRRR